MTREPVTVEEVREAQESLKTGCSLHEQKNFSEAIEAFKSVASIHPYDEKHLDEFQKKLKSGNYKLQQESIAYMGCAAVHLSRLINELDDDQKEQVPIDQSLKEAFKDWE